MKLGCNILIIVPSIKTSTPVLMGGGHSDQSFEEQYKEFHKQIKQVEFARIIVAMDFSYSNKARAQNWGRSQQSPHGSLHASYDIGGQTYSSPYRRALELLLQYCYHIDDSQEGIQLLAFSDSVKAAQMVKKDNALALYDQWAAVFNMSDNYTRTMFHQDKPSVMAPVIHHALNSITNTLNYTILIVLTDGDLGNVTWDTQAIVEASNFPLSICTVGIGESDFSMFRFFDNDLFERKFDNFNFSEFSYAKRLKTDFQLTEDTFATGQLRDAIVDKVEPIEEKEIQRLAMDVFEEVPEQYAQVRSNLKYLDMVKTIYSKQQ